MSKPRIQITVWECCDIEARWIASLCDEQEREYAEYLVREDIALSRRLALDTLDDDSMPVPFYADDWCSIEQPQIIDTGWWGL